MSAQNARTIVEEVLGHGMTRELWTSNYEHALPISVQDFDITAILPAVFYMFRFGVRRGKGKFVETFGSDDGTPQEKRRAATIERVASVLADNELFSGFEDDVTRSILGDLLLCFCLENRNRALGRNEQVIRVAPAHYMASWIDLPKSIANLRFVPEMIVALLSDQQGEYVKQNNQGDKTWFAVGRGFEDNLLLKAFHQGVTRQGMLDDRKADRFQEETPVGLDQLLMIRLANQLGEAPDKLRGGNDKISNQLPIAERASREFSEDIRNFVRGYGDVIPRHAFVELLESCISIGLTTIITSTIEILFEWARTGEIIKTTDQQPSPIFIDCSNGIDRNLREIAEQSLEDFFRRVEYIPAILMTLRLLDHSARYDPKLRRLDISKTPYSTEWLALLGDILCKRLPESQPIFYDIERKSIELAEKLGEEYSEAAAILQNEESQPNPVKRFAESLTFLQGRQSTQSNVMSLIDSASLTNRPHGLAAKRSIKRKVIVGEPAKKRDVRSLVFTDTVLDYLVHRHVLRKGAKSGVSLISFQDFLTKLNTRYGFCIDVSPPGMIISNEQLRTNRLTLERRLRDLGLLVGVNDAEAMKHLRPRFERQEENHVLE